MTPADTRIAACSALSGRFDVFCRGPGPDGACCRAAIGEPAACAGLFVRPARGPGDPVYPVPSTLTLCPVTLARSLAVPTDSTLGG